MSNRAVAKDEIGDLVRERARQYKESNFGISPSFASTETSTTSKMTAIHVLPFWSCPRELLISKLGRHWTGKVKNLDILNANTAMFGLMFYVSFLSGYLRPFLGAQAVLSTIEYGNLSIHDVESNQHRRF